MASIKKVPVILIAEEVDELYRADSEILSFLDGIDTPRNTAGTYILFSTNYPKRIDPRIRKRPGRIDKIISVGALRTKFAGQCAKMYLPEDAHEIIEMKELSKVLDRTTPAEIKEIINIAFSLIKGTNTNFSADVILQARKILKGSLDFSLEDAQNDIDVREKKYRELGPEPDYLSYLND